MNTPFNDRGPFKVGEVCIIVGAKSHRRFIGCEAEITEAHGNAIYAIDIHHPDGKGGWLIREDNLRRKRPATTGEDKIIALFNAPPVERRQPVTAWQAQYDTAQAFMKMGVRVRPGKWLVEV